MLRAFAYIFIALDVIVIAAVNLAFSGAHLSVQSRNRMFLFNAIALGLLALAALLAFLSHTAPAPGRQPRGNWPNDPPE